MRRGDRAHLHLAVVLGAVDAGHIVLVQQFAPGAVGQDHQFRHHLVDGRAAQALADGDAVVLDMEGEVDLLRAVFPRLAACRFQFLRKVPQQFEFMRVGVIELAFRQGLFVEQRFQRVVAQVGSDMQALDAALTVHDRQRIRLNLHIQREGRTDLIRAQGERLHHVVRQHGDLVARHIHSGQALRGDRVDIRTRRDT